jgi:predicted Zn-dependent protease
VCKFGGEERPAVVLIFTQKADDNLVSVVKAVDAVQKTNEKLGTVVVGVGGVEAADFEKIQTTHKLTTPLTIAEEKDGPSKYTLNKEAAVTVVVYKKGGAVTNNFAFKTTKEAAEKAKEIAHAAEEAVK